MRRLLLYLVPFLLTLGGTYALSSEIGNPDPPLWMRYPAISPDGKLIAFSFQDHIFLVKSEGGTATPLTTGPQHDTSPVWSPDGKLIAFASDRYGHSDVFVVGSTGGAVRRLTTYSTDAVPSDFSPDGQFVLFSAHRIGPARSSLFPIRIFPQLYKVAIEGGKKEQLVLTTPAVHARFNKAGNQILYEDIKGFEDPWRKHQTSSVTRDIWLFDLGSSEHRKLTNAAYENRNPVWAADENSTYFLSEKNGSLNVWRISFNPQTEPEQVTFFSKNPVRFLSVSQSGDLCFGYDGEIYLLPSGSKQPHQVQIRTDLANTDAAPALKHFNDNVTEMALSPSGKEIALVVRGDVYVASTEHGETKRITNTPGQERNISFSPDGRKLLFAAEYNKPWAIYEASINQPKEKEPYFFNSTVVDIHPLVENSEENFQPQYSPDGKEVAFLENRTTLKVVNPDSKQSRIILPGEYNYSYEDGDQWFDWSPDSKWFLVNFLDRNRFSLEAGLVDAEGKQQLTNLTKSGYEDVHPEWAMGGTSMIWASDRYGLHGDGYSEKSQSDIYEMFFTQEGFDRSKLSLDEYAILKEKEDTEKKKKAEKAPTPEPGEHKPPEPLKLDLNNIEDRVKRLTLGSSSIMDAALTPDGETLLYLAQGDKGVELWSVKLRDRELKRLAELPVPAPSLTMPQFETSVKLDTEGKNAYVLAGGHVARIKLDDGKIDPLKFSADKEIDAQAERAYIFDHIWREMLEKFYVQDMHGVDWQYYRTVYERFLPFISNNHDFAEMLSEMLGELNASHTGCRYRMVQEEADATAALGVFFDDSYHGAGLRIQEIIEKGPLVSASTLIEAGMILEKIDGVAVDSQQDINPLLNHRAGQPMLLSIFDPVKNGRFDVAIKPISLPEQDELLYERWVKQRRALVDRLSNGTLGYVHVRGMDDTSYRNLFSEALGRDSGKKGLIVDARYNGGGNLHDQLATLLSGKSYLELLPRGQHIGWEPTSKWDKANVVLINECDYSDAQVFPWVYQHLGIGKLIGMPVPGTGTSVWWERQQDPTLVFGIPEIGLRTNTGEFLENVQVDPDIRVMNDPKSVSEGRDLQVERAVSHLMTTGAH